MKDIQRIQPAKGSQPEMAKFVSELPQKLYDAMNDDLMTPEVISLLFEACRNINILVDRKAKISADDLKRLTETMTLWVDDILGLKPAADTADPSREKAFHEAVDMVMEMRQKAKEEKDWATSDAIRDRLQKAGFVVKDTPDGTVWSV